MNAAEIIDKAANLVGGISELARVTEWDKGSIAGVKSGKRPLAPHRAAQLAEIIGNSPEKAYLEALSAQAKTDAERKLLGKLQRSLRAAAAILTIAVVPAVAHFQHGKAGSSLATGHFDKEYTL